MIIKSSLRMIHKFSGVNKHIFKHGNRSEFFWQSIDPYYNLIRLRYSVTIHFIPTLEYMKIISLRGEYLYIGIELILHIIRCIKQ
jgi:hypothetical protein